MAVLVVRDARSSLSPGTPFASQHSDHQVASGAVSGRTSRVSSTGDRGRRRRRPPCSVRDHANSTPGCSVAATSRKMVRGAVACPNGWRRIMRAITVVPGQAGSAQLTEVPEPPVAAGPVLVDTLVIGVCGTDAEIVAAPTAGRPRDDRAWFWATSRWGESATRQRSRVSSPVTWSWASSGYRIPPLRQLRGGRVGHVPQWRLHRARDQAARRLRFRALSHPARLRGESGSGTRPSWGFARAGQRGGQGLGAHRVHRGRTAGLRCEGRPRPGGRRLPGRGVRWRPRACRSTRGR